MYQVKVKRQKKIHKSTTNFDFSAYIFFFFEQRLVFPCYINLVCLYVCTRTI